MTHDKKQPDQSGKQTTEDSANSKTADAARRYDFMLVWGPIAFMVVIQQLATNVFFASVHWLSVLYMAVAIACIVGTCFVSLKLFRFYRRPVLLFDAAWTVYALASLYLAMLMLGFAGRSEALFSPSMDMACALSIIVFQLAAAIVWLAFEHVDRKAESCTTALTVERGCSPPEFATRRGRIRFCPVHWSLHLQALAC